MKKESQELQKYLFDFEIYEIAKLVFKKSFFIVSARSEANEIQSLAAGKYYFLYKLTSCCWFRGICLYILINSHIMNVENDKEDQQFQTKYFSKYFSRYFPMYFPRYFLDIFPDIKLDILINSYI